MVIVAYAAEMLADAPLKAREPSTVRLAVTVVEPSVVLPAERSPVERVVAGFGRPPT